MLINLAKTNMWKFTLWGRSCQPVDRSIYLNELWLSSSSLSIHYFSSVQLTAIISLDILHQSSTKQAKTTKTKRKKREEIKSTSGEETHMRISVYCDQNAKKAKCSEQNKNEKKKIIIDTYHVPCLRFRSLHEATTFYVISSYSASFSSYAQNSVLFFVRHTNFPDIRPICHCKLKTEQSCDANKGTNTNTHRID